MRNRRNNSFTLLASGALIPLEWQFYIYIGFHLRNYETKRRIGSLEATYHSIEFLPSFISPLLKRINKYAPIIIYVITILVTICVTSLKEVCDKANSGRYRASMVTGRMAVFAHTEKKMMRPRNRMPIRLLPMMPN